jgi:hypothetical protein
MMLYMHTQISLYVTSYEAYNISVISTSGYDRKADGHTKSNGKIEPQSHWKQIAI